MARKLKMGPRGSLAEDPQGEYIRWQFGNRIFLGEVTGGYFDNITGRVRLKVKHFNGEPWAHDPPASTVEIIPQSA